jgi:hypothetical protein
MSWDMASMEYPPTATLASWAGSEFAELTIVARSKRHRMWRVARAIALVPAVKSGRLAFQVG